MQTGKSVNSKKKKKTLRRGKYKALSSEAPHAIVPVIFPKTVLSCHKTRLALSSGLVAPFLWQIQNVLLKPVWKMSCLDCRRKGNKR